MDRRCNLQDMVMLRQKSKGNLFLKCDKMGSQADSNKQKRSICSYGEQDENWRGNPTNSSTFKRHYAHSPCKQHEHAHTRSGSLECGALFAHVNVRQLGQHQRTSGNLQHTQKKSWNARGQVDVTSRTNMNDDENKRITELTVWSRFHKHSKIRQVNKCCRNSRQSTGSVPRTPVKTDQQNTFAIQSDFLLRDDDKHSMSEHNKGERFSNRHITAQGVKTHALNSNRPNFERKQLKQQALTTATIRQTQTQQIE